MPIPGVSIQPAPTPLPNHEDRPTFNARAYAHTQWQANELGPKSEQNAVVSYTNAQETAVLAGTATAKAAEAAASASAAANAAGAIKWVAATNHNEGAVVFSPTNYLTYRRKAPGGVDATDPAADTTRTYWEPISVRGLQPRIVTGTAATAVTGELLVITNAAATTITAPATPGTGDRWGYVVCNGRVDNVVNWNGSKHMGLTGTMVLDKPNAFDEPVFINPTYGFWLK